MSLFKWLSTGDHVEITDRDGAGAIVITHRLVDGRVDGDLYSLRLRDRFSNH